MAMYLTHFVADGSGINMSECMRHSKTWSQPQPSLAVLLLGIRLWLLLRIALPYTMLLDALLLQKALEALGSGKNAIRNVGTSHVRLAEMNVGLFYKTARGL